MEHHLLDGMQSALNPQGPQAAVVAEISWLLIGGAALIFIGIMGLTAYAVFARRERAGRISALRLIVGGGIIFPAATLTALLVYSLLRTASLADESAQVPLRIEVIGEQWWWRVHYVGDDGRPDFATANEIRIPVGQPVELALASADVIHGFWVPSLAGKLDMIPGRTNRLRIMAGQPGKFRGQCTEYCGGPHAFMAFYIVADDPQTYATWTERQRQPAAAPVQKVAAQGLDLFVAHCATCHTVRGTRAAGIRGPDLTHVGSRSTIGAGLLTNNTGSLAGWIASNQHLKPGNLMPDFRHFSGIELRALAEYLESLK